MLIVQVLIGCDGVHSVVAQWLGMSEPASSGRSAVWGLSVFPDGHGLKKELRQFLSEGLRAGMVPISDTDVYWFLVNNTISAGKTCSTFDCSPFSTAALHN
jgi:2-polyprenyl-6-methoxyphenol hydroxylase-like FAD-dependent oxidoreductase